MTRRRTLAPALLAALLLVPLSACASSSGDSGGADGIEMMAGSPMSADAIGDGSYASEDAQVDAAGRSVIRTGDISIRVADPNAVAAQAADVAKDLGGHVASQSIDRGGDGSGAGASLQLRVPASRIDEAFAALAELGDVVSESRNTTDVTAEHVDLRARVAALETSVERLTKLMSGAATTSDLLEAEAALSERQQELDGLTAQLTALEDQIDEATIWVQLSSTSTLPGGPANFWDGLVAGWHSLVAAGAGALVGLGILLPWLALVGAAALVVLLIVRAARRGKRA
ncbi:DUF4349 domain-containing protein, partial [Leucobacter soli]